MQYPQYGGSNKLEFLGFMARRLNLSLQSLPAAVEPDAPEFWSLSVSLSMLLTKNIEKKSVFQARLQVPDMNFWSVVRGGMCLIDEFNC